MARGYEPGLRPVLALEYQSGDPAVQARAARWWAARRTSERTSWLPVALVDSGYRWWNPVPDELEFRAPYRAMVTAALTRTDGVAIDAFWTLAGDGQAAIEVAVTNTGAVPLSRADGLGMQLIVFQNETRRHMERFARRVHSPRFPPDLAAGATATYSTTFVLPDVADVGLLDVAVVIDHQAPGGAPAYQSLQAVVACTDRSPPRPTATPTQTATPPPRPSRTPRPPEPVYLPIAYRATARGCASTRSPADIALVLDMSTSMQARTTDGQDKVEAAIRSANLLVDAIHLASGGDPRLRVLSQDQFAVAGFNAEGWVEQPLTTDRWAVKSSLAAMAARLAEYTRTDLGLAAGLEAASGPWHRATGRRVLILLTDGRPNRVPPGEDGTMDATVLRAAERVWQAGIELYTIGFGTDEEVGRDLLAKMARAPSHFRLARDAAELDAIFRELAEEYWCETDIPVEHPGDRR